MVENYKAAYTFKFEYLHGSKFKDILSKV